jgi:hypothetical protein
MGGHPVPCATRQKEKDQPRGATPRLCRCRHRVASQGSRASMPQPHRSRGSVGWILEEAYRCQPRHAGVLE